MGIPWRYLLLSTMLLASLAALLYLVFLHQPPVGPEPPEPEAAASALEDSGRQADRQPPAPLAPYPPEPEPSDAAEPSKSTPAKSTPAAPPATSPPAGATPPPPAPADDQRPRLAIIIDDMGYRPESEQQLLALNREFTFSFIPFAPHLSETLEPARELGREILLHLPLEALDKRWNSAAGILLTAMNGEEIAAGFAAALAQVPMAVGVNNHMGSRFTADHRAMELLLIQVERYDLFFLDSLTTAASVAGEVAAGLKIPILKRDIFLDNQQDEQKIMAELDRLLTIAEERGWAVGIGHPYPATVAALKKRLPELERRARLVPVSKLYREAAAQPAP